MKQKMALSCTKCGTRNYTTTINHHSDNTRLELNKFCKYCNAHTVHKGTK